MNKLYLKRRILAGFSMIAFLGSSALVEAGQFYVGGRLKQGVSLAYDFGENGDQVGPANFIAEIKASYSPNRKWSFNADVWLRGDWYPDLGGNLVGGGIQDFTSPGFNDQFGFRLNQPATGQLQAPFGADAHQIRFLDNFNDDMLRELSVKYRDPAGRFSMKIGKFQRGWGQSDGLRLLDILNPQDLRERFILRDADELRIPAWMATFDLNLERSGLSAPFEAIGLSRTKLEFVFTPEVRHSNFVINNPTPSDVASGGIFAFPFPRFFDPVSQFGLPFIGANLSEITPDKFSVKDAEYAVSFSFEALGAEWSVKGFYGQQDLPVVVLNGADLVIGSALHDPSQAAAVVAFDRNTAIGATHAPGQYLDFVRGVADGSPIPFFLAPAGCIDPLQGMPNCSLTFDFALDYDHRQKVVGMSFTREIGELKLGPKNVSPVIRAEFSYEFDKPFNVSQAMTPFGTVAQGTGALVLDPSVAIVKRDQWQAMLGVDYFLWVPFWKGQEKSIFVSVQFFNIHTQNSANLMQQAPYVSAEVFRNQNFLTFLWNMGLDKQRLIIEGLFIRDVDNKGTAYRQRVDFNYFGDKFRPRLEWIHVTGQNEAGPLGLIKNSDIIEMSLTYQF